jgi:ABC-type glycerol-3-phosphate transport system substrate-binding protein
LPLKSLPEPREGMPSSNGSGTLAIVKNPPHPNATKVFVNWLLGKEGQEIYSRVLLHGTRRLDVDTKWMAKEGVEAAKDYQFERQRATAQLSRRQMRRGAAEITEVCRDCITLTNEWRGEVICAVSSK